MTPERRIDLVKKMSLAIEKESGRKLVNTTSGYELVIRLVAGKDGKFVPLLKLSTIPDWRFSYRKEVLPTSIAPVNAATDHELSEPYLNENARVLDPFCGTGTMLIDVPDCSRVIPCMALIFWKRQFRKPESIQNRQIYRFIISTVIILILSMNIGLMRL